LDFEVALEFLQRVFWNGLVFLQYVACCQKGILAWWVVLTICKANEMRKSTAASLNEVNTLRCNDLNIAKQIWWWRGCYDNLT